MHMLCHGRFHEAGMSSVLSLMHQARQALRHAAVHAHDLQQRVACCSGTLTGCGCISQSQNQELLAGVQQWAASPAAVGSYTVPTAQLGFMGYALNAW
jgi:hypothetical protein